MQAKYSFKFYLLIIFSFCSLTAVQIKAGEPYVILVSFDGYRWDYPERGITPNLDFFKDNGVKALSFRPAFPSKTFPNHFSIITGMYPENHGIIQNEFEDPFENTSYGISDTVSVRNAKWYQGEAFWETAERQGIKTASFFWPGSEVTLSYRHPTYYKKYEHDLDYGKRIDGVIDWLKLPYNERPHFLTMYFHETDSKGHRFGTTGIEINNAIHLLDSLVGDLYKRLKDINMADSVDIILLSDHGMTNLDKERKINIESLLDIKCKIIGFGPVMMIEPPKQKVEEVYLELKKSANHFRVFKKNEVPEYLHFSKNPLISSIVVVADLGWVLYDNSSEKIIKRYSFGGDHGYDNSEIDMHGIFYAIGPHFKKNFLTGTLNNIDVYPLLSKIFGIQPRNNIDGKLERIEFILNK